MKNLGNLTKTATVVAEPQLLAPGIGLIIAAIIFMIISLSTFATGHWIVGSFFMVLTLLSGFFAYKYMGYVF